MSASRDLRRFTACLALAVLLGAACVFLLCRWSQIEMGGGR